MQWPRPVFFFMPTGWNCPASLSEVKKRGWTMIVTMQNKGRSGSAITGLYIGLGNVRRHFPEGVRVIELELEDLRIECELKASFWRDQPEITDPRLCAWLEAKNAQSRGSVISG